MNITKDRYYTNFAAKVNIENVKGSNRNWKEILQVVESKTNDFKDGYINIETNKDGLLENLIFDRRYVASFDNAVAKKLNKLNDNNFANKIVEYYKSWIWKINNIFG